MSRRQQRARLERRRHASVRARVLRVGGGALVATLAPAAAAHAATYPVNNLNDSGAGSLRQAITDANTNGQSATAGVTDDIVFASGLSGSIHLATALPDVADQNPLDIQGPGARQVTVDASAVRSNQPVLYDDTGALLTISGLSMDNANAGTSAGGFINVYNAPLTLDSDAFVNDSAEHGGGAVLDSGGSLTVTGSAFSGDSLTLGNGGAISMQYAGVTIENSTISGNSAPGAGGGLYLYDASATITGSTIASNSSGPEGGGIAALGGRAVTLQDSIVALNSTTPSTHRDVYVAFGSSMAAHFSLIQNDASGPGMTTDATDITGQDPQLGALENNGGPTDTRAPAASSPVIDQGQAFGLTSDQRGFPRPAAYPGKSRAAGGDGSDMGAVELNQPSVSAVSPASGPAGSKVTITGSNLSRATGVSFGTVAASFIVLDDGHITATVPAGTGPTVDVRVSAPDGESQVVSADRFSYAPTVSGLSERSGVPGTTLRISGQDLTGATGVNFGTTPAAFKVLSDTSIQATIPTGAGTIDVTVTGPGGRSATDGADRFTFTSPGLSKSHHASAHWKGKSVVINPGITVSCPAGPTSCKSVLSAHTVVPATAARVRKRKTHKLNAGSVTVFTHAGQHQQLTFKLSAKALKALQKLGVLRITVQVIDADAGARSTIQKTITIRLPKKPKPHHHKN